jgi:hypothetical protein
MVVAAHQPDYIPWLGYFHKISKADIFVFLDDVQFSNEGGHNRNLIKTPQGSQWLTVPVQKSYYDPINKVRTMDEYGWKKKHLRSIELNYKRAPFFNEVFPVISELLLSKYLNIAEMNGAIIQRISKEFGFTASYILSSYMDIKTAGEQRIIDICRNLGARAYYSGHGAKAYQNPSHFAEYKIELIYSDYRPVQYPQLWGEFTENLSVVDYVMNCGFERWG